MSDKILETDEDKKIFIEAITNPAPPNEKLKQAQKQYEKFKLKKDE